MDNHTKIQAKWKDYVNVHRLHWLYNLSTKDLSFLTDLKIVDVLKENDFDLSIFIFHVCHQNEDYILLESCGSWFFKKANKPIKEIIDLKGSTLNDKGWIGLYRWCEGSFVMGRILTEFSEKIRNDVRRYTFKDIFMGLKYRPILLLKYVLNSI